MLPSKRLLFLVTLKKSCRKLWSNVAMAFDRFSYDSRGVSKPIDSNHVLFCFNSWWNCRKETLSFELIGFLIGNQWRITKISFWVSSAQLHRIFHYFLLKKYFLGISIQHAQKTSHSHFVIKDDLVVDPSAEVFYELWPFTRINIKAM